MLEGKVSSAMKWISSRTSENGAPVDINEKVLNQLRQKHPSAKPAEENHLLQGPIFQHDPIRFEEIDEDSIYDAAIIIKWISWAIRIKCRWSEENFVLQVIW